LPAAAPEPANWEALGFITVRHKELRKNEKIL